MPFGIQFRCSYLKPAGLFLFAASAALTLNGCGSSGTSGSPPPSGNSTITLLATSTANDRLTQFDLAFNDITLTNASGKTVSLLSDLEHAEFVHLNGEMQPLLTVTVPEDTYTAATATIGPADFVCLGGAPGGKTAGLMASYGYTPDSHITVNLPAPLRISGGSTALSLELDVSESATWTPSKCGPVQTFSITPTFNLTDAGSATLASGSMHGLAGLITAIDAGGSAFKVDAADAPLIAVDRSGNWATWKAPAWTIKVSGSTKFQGVSGFSALTTGMPVDMDANLQADGSLLAERVAVADTNSSILSVFTGPLMRVRSFEPAFEADGTEQYGYFESAESTGGYLGATAFSFDHATFQITGQLSNLQQLPFAAKFEVSNMVGGEMVSITWHATSEQPEPIFIPATTITLLPQTLDGTVQAVSKDGDFDTYTISLASYDLFPQFADLWGQTTVLSDPATVIVYADSNVRRLNTEAITPGSVIRFHGVVFNDGGALKMDCLAILDGVAG